MSRLARREMVPEDLVMVAYVRLDQPTEPNGADVKGILTHWQFVEAQPDDFSLPVEFGTRYRRQLW